MNKQNAKYVERLEQLIRVMRGLNRHERTKHFNMAEWGEETECGTTMCAAGFAGSDPWFQKRGFVLAKGPGGSFYPKFKELVQWDAILAFFGSLPGDGVNGKNDWVISGDDVCRIHPVFAKPESVGEVIRAAKARIKLLKAAA